MDTGELTSGPLGTYKIDNRRVMFQPQENITAFELANCLILLEHMRDRNQVNRLKLLSMAPPEVIRHFEVVDGSAVYDHA